MPKGIEIERKYVIEMPNTSELCHLEAYTVSHITQTYLESDDDVAHRVRKREFFDHTQYTETKKIRIDKMSVHELEREINEAEYTNLVKNIKQGTEHLYKTRHTFSHLGKTIEIDIYPYWKKSCIMEIELESREEEINIPSFINVITEVTGDKTYSNAQMASKFPKEICS
jgi:CYTH domain-containing protein